MDRKFDRSPKNMVEVKIPGVLDIVAVFQDTEVTKWLLFLFPAEKWVQPNQLGTRIVTAGSKVIFLPC